MKVCSAILVAEDEADDAFFLKRALVEAGVIAPIRFVRNGREALDYLQGKPPYDDRVANPFPTLLILDLHMPVLSGFEVLDWRQHQPKLRRIPAVVFSALEGEPNISRAYGLGANHYLSKTHDPSGWPSLLKPLVEEYGLVVNPAVLKPGIGPQPGPNGVKSC